MVTSPSVPTPPSFLLDYAVLRSVVSPEDQDAGRKRYCGVAKADQFFDLAWDENVRAYLGEDEEGKKRKSTLVNLAIRDTVSRNRDFFPMLNTGLVIVARSVTVDDKNRRLRAKGASIINGAQTKGVLTEYFHEHPDDEDYPSVNFELIVTDNEELIGDISIARNFQNRVADLSIYGRQGLFDDLEAALQRHDPAIKLRTRETDFDDSYLDTEKLVQVITALMPPKIAVPSADKRRGKTPETIYRVYAYRHRARCLKDFATIMRAPKQWPEAYRYYLDVAWDGWATYRKLKAEQVFSPLHKVKGQNAGSQKKVLPEGVPDGLVFPMLSALSSFVDGKPSGHWKLTVPSAFPWGTLFEHAMVLFKSTANHNPNAMGKHADCYVALHGLCKMFFAVKRESLL